MDRDRDARLEQRGGPSGGLGVEVSRPDSGSPAPDRQQRDIESPAQLLHLGEEVGVAREVDPAAPPDVEADRVGDRAADGPAAVGMLGPGRGDLDLPDGRDLTRLELRHLGESRAAEEVAGAARGEDANVALEPAQRGQVEMVLVQVGDQHRVDLPRDAGVGRRPEPAQVREPAAEHGIGEQADAAELEKERGVPDVGEAAHPPGGSLPCPMRRSIPSRRDSISSSLASTRPLGLRDAPPCLLDQQRGDRGGYHREKGDPVEHQKGADQPARGVVGHHVSVADRGHRLDGPPQPVAESREILPVERARRPRRRRW